MRNLIITVGIILAISGSAFAGGHAYYREADVDDTLTVGLSEVTDGSIVLSNSTNLHQVTIDAVDAVASFTLTIPADEPTTGDQVMLFNVSGDAVWSSVMTSESDTLDTVCDRGATTDQIMVISNSLFVSGTGTFGTLAVTNDATIIGDLYLTDTDIHDIGKISCDSIIADGSALAIGDGTETISLDTSDWDISTTGAVSGIGPVTVDDILHISSSAESAIDLSGSSVTNDIVLQNSETITNSLDGSVTIDALILGLGSGAAGVDYILRFHGEDNTGDITWQEDENNFAMTCSLSVSEKVTGDSISDGTATMTGGALSGITTLDASGSVTANAVAVGSDVLGATEFGFLTGQDQDVSSSGNPTFGGVTIDNVHASNIYAFTLAGKITGGSSEIEGANFDINGGNIDGTAIGVSSTSTGQFSTITPTYIDIGANRIDTTEWANLDGLNQAVSTTSQVTFLTVTPTYIDIGANRVDTNEWAYLDGLDQSVSSTSTPAFNAATIADIHPTNVYAFTLGGKLTGGAQEIESSNFDIDGGAIDGTPIGSSSADMGHFTLITGDQMLIGSDTPSSYPLEVTGDKTGFMESISNVHGTANSFGILMQAGAADASGQTYYMYCVDGDGTEVGYIEVNNGTFRLVNSSDERLKENIVDTSLNGLDVINAIKVRDFKWKQSEITGTGFIAQELHEVYPKAVSGEPEATMPDGKTAYMGVSQSDLVPVLVKAIQELSDRIKALEEKP